MTLALIALSYFYALFQNSCKTYNSSDFTSVCIYIGGACVYWCASILVCMCILVCVCICVHLYWCACVLVCMYIGVHVYWCANLSLKIYTFNIFIQMPVSCSIMPFFGISIHKATSF